MPVLHSSRGIPAGITIHSVHRGRFESQYYCMNLPPSFLLRLVTFIRVSHLATYIWLIHCYIYIYRLRVVYTIIVRRLLYHSRKLVSIVGVWIQVVAGGAGLNFIPDPFCF